MASVVATVADPGMSFLLACPNCGERSVYEFRFGGEYRRRPPGDVSTQEWTDYIYTRRNSAGEQQEWWYHHLGCHRWFLAVRDTTTNAVRRTFSASEEQP